jgi:hypothetical protein
VYVGVGVGVVSDCIVSDWVGVCGCGCGCSIRLYSIRLGVCLCVCVGVVGCIY